VDEPDFEIRQRELDGNFLRLDGERVRAPVDPTRSSELEEVGGKDTRHLILVEPCLSPPELLFELPQLFQVV